MARGNSRKPLWHSRLACSSSSRTTSGRDALNDVPGMDDRPSGTQSKPSRFDVHRMKYGLRSRELPGNITLSKCFTDGRLRNTEVEERDRSHSTHSAELCVPLLGFTRVSLIDSRMIR